MVCATMYEYRSGVLGSRQRRDAESLSASNNNERLAEYADKNLVAEELRIGCDGSTVQDNDKELIDKGKSPKCANLEAGKPEAIPKERGWSPSLPSPGP
jgi:hypothetical protein